MKTKITLTFKYLAIFIFAMMTFASCTDEVKVENKFWTEEEAAAIKAHFGADEVFYDYEITYPNYTNFPVRRMDDKLASLGRVIFYDKNLSKDKKISCASCHNPEIGFSDDKALSQGIENRVTSRNSLALGSSINFAAYYGEGMVPFFWDNRVNTVQEQSTQTFANENEMGMEMHQVASVVNSQPYYAPIIKKVFNKETVTEQEVLDALAEFTNSITHFNSKFDKVLDTKSSFTSQEKLGYDLYKANCASCHGTNLGAPSAFAANNGLATIYKDFGAGTSNSTAKFKVPTLRNILVTGPYMHDGSLATIDDVIEHYSTGIKAHPALDYRLENGTAPKKMNFSQADKDNLKAFFGTLTDHTTSDEKKFADPFL